MLSGIPISEVCDPESLLGIERRRSPHPQNPRYHLHREPALRVRSVSILSLEVSSSVSFLYTRSGSASPLGPSALSISLIDRALQRPRGVEQGVPLKPAGGAGRKTDVCWVRGGSKRG